MAPGDVACAFLAVPRRHLDRLGWHVVVVDNIVSSLFKSRLFDFSRCWLYVFGVGVAGGMALQQRLPAVETRPVAER
jgi:hypothetical protein